MRNLSSLIITSFVHRRWLVWQNTEKVVNHLFSGTSLREVFSAFLVWRSEYSNLLLIKPFPDLVHKRSPSEEQDYIDPERESGCIMCALGELVELRDVGVVICTRPEVERILESEAVRHYVKGGQNGRPYDSQGKNLDGACTSNVRSGRIDVCQGAGSGRN